MQRTTFLIFLLLVLSSIVEAVAAPQSPVGGLGVSGTWRPRAAQADPARRVVASPADFESAWEVSKEQIQLTIPPRTSAAYEIARDEPFPESEWTLDFWLLHYDSDLNGDVTFFLGDKSASNYFELNLEPGLDYAEVRLAVGEEWQSENYRAAAGPLQWVRIAYSRSRRSLLCFINGEPIAWKDKFVPLSRTPAGFTIKPHFQHDQKAIVEISGFQVTEGIHVEPSSVPGLAFSGWRIEPAGARTQRTVMPAELPQRLETLMNTPGLHPQGRAYALAALLLADRLANGQLSPARWEQTVQFVDKSLDIDLASLSILLPVAIASADVATDENRRLKTETWVRHFFDAVPSNADRIAGGGDAVLKRVSLLDPARTARFLLQRRPSLPLVRAVSGDLHEASPSLALSLYRTFERTFPAAEAWLLPETRSLSPTWGRLMIRRLRESGSQKSFISGEPDHSLSFAAYRLAASDFPQALEFVNLIQNPSTQAETLDAIDQELPSGPQTGGRDLDAAIESALKKAITIWKPSARDDSPVPQMVRLAQWYASRNRHQEAQAVLQLAIPKVGALPSTRFRDTWAIARLTRDLKLPESAAWLEKAKQTALALDKERDEPDQMGTTVYFAATTLVVTELVKQENIDEALAMTRQLDRDLLEMNYGINMARIISAVADTNFPRALQLLKELPSEGRRVSVLSGLIVKLARKDVPAALKLLETLPTESRGGPALRMAEFVPVASSPALQKIIGEAISTKLKAQKDTRHSFDYTFFSRLAKLPVATLLALEPRFEDDRGFYAMTLLAAIAHTGGLAEDPIWRRMMDAERPHGWSIPWTPARLRDAVRAEESNREQNLE